MLERLCILFILLMASSVSADPPVNVSVYPATPNIRFVNPNDKKEDKVKNPCFPFNCKDGISGPITNPAPREPNEIPACYYDADGVLFYEKEGSKCSYKRTSEAVKDRIERRRQEWLRSQESRNLPE